MEVYIYQKDFYSQTHIPFEGDDIRKSSLSMQRYNFRTLNTNQAAEYHVMC